MATSADGARAAHTRQECNLEGPGNHQLCSGVAGIDCAVAGIALASASRACAGDGAQPARHGVVRALRAARQLPRKYATASPSVSKNGGADAALKSCCSCMRLKAPLA